MIPPKDFLFVFLIIDIFFFCPFSHQNHHHHHLLLRLVFALTLYCFTALLLYWSSFLSHYTRLPITKFPLSKRASRHVLQLVGRGYWAVIFSAVLSCIFPPLEKRAVSLLSVQSYFTRLLLFRLLLFNSQYVWGCSVVWWTAASIFCFFLLAFADVFFSLDFLEFVFLVVLSAFLFKVVFHSLRLHWLWRRKGKEGKAGQGRIKNIKAGRQQSFYVSWLLMVHPRKYEKFSFICGFHFWVCFCSLSLPISCTTSSRSLSFFLTLRFLQFTRPARKIQYTTVANNHVLNTMWIKRCDTYRWKESVRVIEYIVPFCTFILCEAH